MRNPYINWKKQGYDELLTKMPLASLAKKINHENPGRAITGEDLERRRLWLVSKTGVKKPRRSLMKRAPEGAKEKYEEVTLDNSGFISKNNISYSLSDFATLVAKDNWEFVTAYRGRDSQKAVFRCKLDENAVPLFQKEKSIPSEESVQIMINYIKNLNSITDTTGEVASVFMQKAKLPGFNAAVAKDILLRLVSKALGVLIQDNVISVNQSFEVKKSQTA